MGKKNKNKLFSWFIFLCLGGFIFKLLGFLFKNKKEIKHNLDDFFKEELREVKELASGEEDFNTYCKDSFCLFKDYFIPNPSNDHKPLILRTKSLAIMAVFLLFIKLSVTGYLFFIYPSQGIMNNVIISRVHTLINIDRQENNLPLLEMNSVLSMSALAKADDMILNDYFAHNSPDGKKPWDWIDRSQYPYLFVGENLAMNFSSADAVHNALMLSPTHKKNILNEKFNEVGLAMTRGVINGKETNVLVQLFAFRKIEIETPSEDAKLEIIAAAESNLQIDSEPIKVASESTEPKTTIEPISNITEPEIPVTEPVKSTDTSPEPVEAPPVIFNEIPSSVLAQVEIQDLPEPDDLPEAVIQEEFVEEEVDVIPQITEAIVAEETFDFNVDLNTQIVYVNPEAEEKFKIATFLVKASKYIYLIALIFIIAALIVNIIIRTTIQHKSIIIQTVLLIIFIIGLIFVHLHILESLLNGIAII